MFGPKDLGESKIWGEKRMDIAAMMAKVKAHPDFSKAGMILCHNGVVRENTREGEPVTELSIQVDHDLLSKIIDQQKAKPGIIEVLVHIEEGKPLKVGDDIMALVVAGDIRENVIETLTDTLNQIKSRATRKTQVYK